jgi:hypothetical protein
VHLLEVVIYINSCCCFGTQNMDTIQAQISYSISLPEYRVCAILTVGAWENATRFSKFNNFIIRRDMNIVPPLAAKTITMVDSHMST